ALQQRLHARRLRYGGAAQLEEVHDAADLGERGILAEVELGEHLLVGDARAARREMRALEREAERPRGELLVLVQPGERRLGIDEAPDQPGAGQPVRPGRLARRPRAAEKFLARARRRLRLRSEEKLAHGRLGIDERALGAAARRGGKEIERGDRLELPALLVQHARDRARVRMPEADAQALDRLDQLLVT